MLEFRETGDHNGHKSIAVIKDREKFGWIYWSGEQYVFFDLVEAEMSIDDMKPIIAEMERLTAELSKSLFCTFDE